MHSLLEALQEGRLVELPENCNKEAALTILANLIEAVPSVPPGTDVAGAVLAREATGNTALGKAWACPHARLTSEGDLVCAVGWSPSGIDYGSPDNRPVHIVAMYLVPTNQKNAYLREISAVARALQNQPDDSTWRTLRDLTQARNALLDMISAALEAAGPEVRARMVRLEAKQAASAAAISGVTLAGLSIQAVTIIAGSAMKPVVLTQNRELMEQLEAVPGLANALGRDGTVDVAGWRILSRSSTFYPGDRVVFDCLALKSVANRNSSIST
ncbi:MAG: PTS sugar transporter subunit IIA [Kiritimatiellae bacterium]|nr:PTS sugar transporter subunit IIA [Kiritimatiellia bacterium]